MHTNPIVLGVSSLALFASASRAQVLIDDAGTLRNGKVGAFSSLAAQGGQVAVAYQCTEDFDPPTLYDLRFAWREDGVWNRTTVDDGSSGFCSSLARAADGAWHIVYVTNQGITWATGSPGSWTIMPEKIDPSLAATYPCLALDSSGLPHVTYFEHDLGEQWWIRYAHWNGTAWERFAGAILARDSGMPTRYMVLDSTRRPHIVYALTTGEMRHAYLTPAGWYVETIPGFMPASGPALAIDEDDVLHVAFRAGSGLVHGSKAPRGVWIVTDVTQGLPSAAPAGSISIALDQMKEPVISFAMTSAEDLYLAGRRGDDWRVIRLDGDGISSGELILGRYATSVACDQTGRAHVSYTALSFYDGVNVRSDLRYATAWPSCPADFNGDWQADFFDYLDFVLLLDREDPAADFNRDGQVDFFDYLDFAAAFSAGCD